MTDTTVLTPSEILLINGDILLPERPDLMSFYLPRGKQVEPEPAAVLVLQAALLGAEQAGALRVEESGRSRLFGLLKTREIRIRPSGTAPQWPESTLEGGIQAILRAAGADGVTPRELLQSVIPEMKEIPASRMLHDLARGLTTRGLAEMRTVKKRIKDYEYEPTLAVLTAQGEAAALAHPIGPIQALIEDARTQRKELSARLEAELRKAIRARHARTGGEMPDLPEYD